MNIKNYRFLGILGIPFIGINHLANMISTSKYVTSKIDVDDYKSYVNDLYDNNNGPNFHIGHKHQEMLYPIDYTIAEQFIKSNTLTTVLPGHVDDAFYILPKIRYLGKQALITIENYNIDMRMPARRRKRIEKILSNNIYKFLYDKDVVCRLFDLPDEDVLAIDIADFHNEEITCVIQSLNNQFELDLDIEFCQSMHTRWMNKVFREEYK